MSQEKDTHSEATDNPAKVLEQASQGQDPIAAKWQRTLAVIISYICHPLFFPTIMLMVISWLDISAFAGIEPKTKWYWIGISAYQTIFFPAVALFLMWRLKFIKSLYLKTKKERIIPYIATMVFYFWIFQLFKREFHAAPHIVTVFFLGAYLGIIVIFIINIFLKISMHTSAAGGMVGIMLLLLLTSQVNFLIPFVIALLIAGIIGTARMILKAHSHLEIWLGYLAGFAAQIAAFYILK